MDGQDEKDNVINLEAEKLIRESESALEDMEAMFHAALPYAADPKVQVFLDDLSKALQEIHEEFKKLNEDIDAN